jgi:hypothetical protein
VGAIWVVNEIAAAHLDATLPKQSFEDKCVPKLELGNEGSLGNALSLRSSASLAMPDIHGGNHRRLAIKE